MQRKSTHQNQTIRRFTASRQAFTLVELLVVCAVMVILAALTLVVISTVAHSTKVTKTRTTIQKLDAAMLQIFETYDDQFAVIKKRLALDNPDLDDESRQKIAAHFIRDLMRMELPQTWAEVDADPIEITHNGTSYAIDASPLLDYYRRAGSSAARPPSQAALLFLIIQNLRPEALEAFHGSEVADTDGDGLLEFVDAWGNPIRFLRWAPAFSDSDLQQNVLSLCDPPYVPQPDMQTNRTWWIDRDDRLQKAMEVASVNHPDLLDERQNTVGWFLYPLIYSAGADGRYGIHADENFPPTIESGNILDPFALPYGMPEGSSHFDNIHNHQWYR